MDIFWNNAIHVYSGSNDLQNFISSLFMKLCLINLNLIMILKYHSYFLNVLLFSWRLSLSESTHRIVTSVMLANFLHLQEVMFFILTAVISK